MEDTAKILEEEYRIIRREKIKNVLIGFLIALLLCIPGFFYFRISTQAHIAFREAKNIKLATTMLSVEFYGTGQQLFDRSSPDGMNDEVRERLLGVTQNRGRIRLLGYDNVQRAVTAFTYESGHIKVTYYMNRDGEESWTVDYVFTLDKYTSESKQDRGE